MSIYPTWMHTVYTQIPTDCLSWSEGPKPVPTDNQRVCLNNSMGKQHSLISIVHWSAAMRHHCSMYVGDTDDTITSYSTIVGTFGLVRMWWEHVLHSFILQSDWLLKILRGNGQQKIHKNTSRPLSKFFRQCPGTRLLQRGVLVLSVLKTEWLDCEGTNQRSASLNQIILVSNSYRRRASKIPYRNSSNCAQEKGWQYTV